MKKAMKQLFQKGISGILCAAMILTSLSIPEMTAYATETGITEETENADVTNEEGTEAEVTGEGSDREDANSEAGGGDSADDTVDAPDEDASEGSTDETPNEDISEGSAGESAPETDKDNNSIDSDEINLAVEAGTVVTLNYYYGETGKTLGVHTWQWDKLQFADEYTWAGSWDLGGWNGDVYSMKESEEYAGWYSIGLKINDASDSGNGFEIHSSDNSKVTLFKCGASGENSAIYNQLVSGNATSYAVKNGKCYADDLVTDIMRNVTLYVYSESGVPSIAINDGLSYIDEEAGSKKSYTKSGTADNRDLYNMTKDTGNWYKLTFIAPNPALVGGEGSETGAEMCKLYIDGKWNMDFANGPVPDDNKTWQCDFTPVFAGKTCYVNSEFLDDSVMRNVTLYVYSKDNVPSIMSTTKLSYLDVEPAEGTESVKLLTADDTKSGVDNGTTWYNYYYNMKADTGGWYTLTFIAPNPAPIINEADSTESAARICDLNKIKIGDNDEKSYEFEKGFANGSTENSWEVDFTPVFAGNVYYKDGAFYAAKAVSLGDLNKLLVTAKATTNDNYTDTSWDALQTAITAANKAVSDLADKDDTYTDDDSETVGDTTLTTAYNGLKAAIDGLVKKDINVTFYYYAGDTNGKEVGVYHWCSNNNINSDAATAGFKAWGTTDIWKMEPAGYTGWYTIDFTLSGNKTDDSNFRIFIQSDNQNPVFKCGNKGNTNGGENYTVYEALFSGDESSYAVKAFDSTNKLYSGETEVNAAMREVTLYVYSESGTPAIGSASELSKINATSGEIENLTADSTDADVNYYNMTAVTDKANWYSLTFSAPVPAEDSHEICKLYTYDNSAYAPVKTFTDNDPADGDTDSVNFSKVFSGSVYYNDGQFYKSMELAEAGITLKMLRDYVNSEPVTTIENNGETYYTEVTWTKFNTAKTKVDTLITSLAGADENTKSPAITEAYDELKAAVDGMKKQDTPVTFYYYNDSIAADEELGLTFGDDDTTTSTEDTYTDWYVWHEGDAHKMTAVEGYPGWYTIPVVFASEGTTSAWCRISSHKEGDPENTTKQVQVYDNNYPILDGKTVYAYKGRYYVGEELVNLLMRNVALYVYDETAAPTVGTANQITGYVDESTGEKVAIADVEAVDGVYYYDMKITEDTGWYSLKFAAPQAGDNNEIGKVSGGADSDLTLALIEGAATEPNSVDLTQYFGKSLYYKDGQIYNARPYTVEELKALIKEAEKLRDDDQAAEEDGKNKYYHDSKDDNGKWDDFVAKIAAADEVAKKEKPADDEIKTVYDELRDAMKALVRVPQEAEIKVKSVPISDDFITGADISSYYALKQSGVVFKDEKGNPLSDQGFFDYLYEGGMNWARIRIWNDPYNSSGKGYGGGNNDLEKAKVIGKWASNAGMKVLIDFHYSDFWADPSKQKAPKAWAGYSVEQKEKAVYDYTLDSLNELRDYGVEIGMVQVGNETNNGICGETNWENMAKIFNAGSKAVRAFDENCLVAVHFTDPQNGYGTIAGNLEKYKVEYDVFASSYYPFGHGDAANLKAVLEDVVKTYGKKVMAAETSWPTTLIDGDGYGTTSPPNIPDKYEDQDYGVSVQGQADEMRALIEKVNEINDVYAGSSLGVFYWEPAWISPYYIKDDEGNDIESLYNQNFALWEEHGSGWASSYAAEYDPDDAGVWYGGSAMDNSSWFDFDGTALPTARIYSLIRTGAVADLKIASVDSKPTKEVNLGEDIKWNDVTVTAKYNDGTKKELSVTWEEEETELVNTDKAGEYIVHGTVSEEGKIYKITMTVRVLRASANNILKNPDFENENSSKEPWVVDPRIGSAGNKDVVRVTDEEPHSGEKGLHFWSEIGLDFTVSQTVEPEAGTYMFGAYIQGGGADKEDVQYAFARVTDKDGKQKSYQKAAFSLKGYLNWANPEVTDITVETGDTLEVGLIMKSTKEGAWGTIDDFYLYGTHTVSVANGINGTVTTNVVKANSGEKIIVTVTPDGGYYPTKLTLSGASVTADTLTSENGSVAYVPAEGDTTVNQAVLTYTGEKAEEMQESFMMPNGNVTVTAEFASAFATGKIDLSAKGDDGKYLVAVNAGESDDSTGETPIAPQFHTGKNVTPAVELSYKGYKLTSADYTVKYENNKNKTTDASKAKITLTAKGDKFTGKREISFEIKDDTRSDFNAKKFKVVFEASDKNGRTDKAAQAVYYLGAEKEIEPKISLYNAADDIKDKNKAIDPSMYKVYYQNNKKIGKATLVVLPSAKALGMTDGYKDGSITSTFTIAKCPINQNDVEIKMSDKLSYYTGKKVEPAVTVTYEYTDPDDETQTKTKTVTLVKGRDYTVSYTNNVNASVYADKDGKYQTINPKKVPTVKITGKGNYTGVRTTYAVDAKGKPSSDKKITFDIYPRSIVNTTITVSDLAAKTSAQAPKITVKDGTKTVAASQYVIEEIVKTHDAENKSIARTVIYSSTSASGTPKVKEAGTYEITIAGKAKSNYANTKNEDNKGFNDKLTFKVTDKKNLIANAKISISGKFYYTGEQIKLSTDGTKPNLTVKAGTETLKEFASLKAATKDNVEQDGYYVTYRNNVSAGKAEITITGTGKYAGTKTSTFTINKRTIAKQASGNDKIKKGEIQIPKISVKVAEEKLDGVWSKDDANGVLINSDDTQKGLLEIPYTGYTINPDFKFSSDNYYDGLEEGKSNIKEMATGDYTVSYKVGKWANGKAPVTVTVKGKGNYSGSVKFDNLFTLTERDISKLSIKVASATYNGKPLKPAVTFYDENGKVVDLKLGTAYTVTYKNNKEANQKSDKQPTVTIKQKGKGWSSTSAPIIKTFAIEQAEINKPDIEDVKFQTFLGKALKPKVTIKVNGRKLKEGKDYTMTYSKNVKRGDSATVTITGKGNYFTREPIVKTFIIK